eukprot:COSAG01_NODE_5528_length_4204_cov_9.376249_1_plen_156_part_10
MAAEVASRQEAAAKLLRAPKDTADERAADEIEQSRKRVLGGGSSSSSAGRKKARSPTRRAKGLPLTMAGARAWNAPQDRMPGRNAGHGGYAAEYVGAGSAKGDDRSAAQKAKARDEVGSSKTKHRKSATRGLWRFGDRAEGNKKDTCEEGPDAVWQ